MNNTEQTSTIAVDMTYALVALIRLTTSLLATGGSIEIASVMGECLRVQGRFPDLPAAEHFIDHAEPVTEWGPHGKASESRYVRGTFEGLPVQVLDVRPVEVSPDSFDPEHDERDPSLDPDYDPSPYHQWQATEPRGLSTTEAHQRVWQQRQEARS